MSLSKQEQWKMAAARMKYLRKAHPHYEEPAIAFLTECDLCRQHKTLPWEYPWSEVVASLRSRSEAALAKRRKSR